MEIRNDSKVSVFASSLVRNGLLTVGMELEYMKTRFIITGFSAGGVKVKEFFGEYTTRISNPQLIACPTARVFVDGTSTFAFEAGMNNRNLLSCDSVVGAKDALCNEYCKMRFEKTGRLDFKEGANAGWSRITEIGIGEDGIPYCFIQYSVPTDTLK